VRNRLALAEIVPALKAAGIRYRAIEIEQLGEKQVVQDLYAITRALLHLGDRIAWLSLLRAPWLALPLDKLLEIGEDKNRFKTIWELIKDDLFLADFTRILAPAIANRARGSLRERVEGVWLALGGPACVADKTELEDAERYLDELEKLEEHGPLTDPAVLRDTLERLYALPDVDATDDDLQIMTIHKAKGLEFGTVIVPGLDSGPGGGDPDLLLFNELVRPPDKGGSEPPASGGLLLAPIKATGEETHPTYRYLRDLDAAAEDVESSRLLYVAATRAENRLHLLACLGCDKDGELKKPIARSLLSRAWRVAEASFKAHGAAVADDGTDRVEEIYAVNRLARGFRVPSLPQAVRWTAQPDGRKEIDIEFSWVGEVSRHVGTVVHRWLQRVASDELRGWDPQRIDSLGDSLARELQRRGVSLRDVRASASVIVVALKNAISDKRGRWVLGPHADARSEYRLRVLTSEGTRTLVVDRLFRDDDGSRWIVDYKTSSHEGSDLEAFLDRERMRYAPQLTSYAEAIAGSRQGLYFPLLRGWRET
jgi:ATP-dependent exoDNAse (exonuclease V) beta subunit